MDRANKKAIINFRISVGFRLLRYTKIFMAAYLQIIDNRDGYQICKKIASYNALFDTENSVIEGKIALFWSENCLELMGWLGPTPHIQNVSEILIQ